MRSSSRSCKASCTPYITLSKERDHYYYWFCLACSLQQVSRVKVQPTHVFSLLIIFTCKLLYLHYFDSWYNALSCIGGYIKEPKSVTAFDLFTNFTCKFNPIRSPLETVLDLCSVYVRTKDMGLLVVNGTNINIK